jgi:hypothetical protein
VGAQQVAQLLAVLMAALAAAVMVGLEAQAVRLHQVKATLAALLLEDIFQATLMEHLAAAEQEAQEAHQPITTALLVVAVHLLIHLG